MWSITQSNFKFGLSAGAPGLVRGARGLLLQDGGGGPQPAAGRDGVGAAGGEWLHKNFDTMSLILRLPPMMT